MAQSRNSVISSTAFHQHEAGSAKRVRGKALPPDKNGPGSAPDSAPAAVAKVAVADQSSSAGIRPGMTQEAESKPSGSPTYDIGYKKPPKKHQFKPGQSGNPKGRAKGARNIWTILQEEARIVVAFSENGKPTRASKQQLAIKSAMNKAVKGDLRALQIILKLFETHAPSSETGGRGTAAQMPAISRQDMDREILDMLGLSEHLSPSEGTSVDPPPDDTEEPKN